MQTMTRKPTTEPTTLEQAKQALADVQRQIGMLNVQHMALSNDLGDALSAARLGDKKAETTAGKLSMKRAGVDTERDRLRLEVSALTARIETMEAGEHERLRDAALASLARITAEAQQAQEDLAAPIIAAGETGQRLNHLGKAWARARAEAGRLGGDISAYPKAPAPAAALFQPRILTKPTRRAKWRSGGTAISRRRQSRRVSSAATPPRWSVNGKTMPRPQRRKSPPSSTSSWMPCTTSGEVRHDEEDPRAGPDGVPGQVHPVPGAPNTGEDGDGGARGGACGRGRGVGMPGDRR